ncbi:MAG: hypothetical protein DWQ01_01610 [Planctomycetota bacterium]|nr:MAG: hypothetical protein DWQ01_01610 [Planctomycetota bacterium]
MWEFIQEDALLLLLTGLSGFLLGWLVKHLFATQSLRRQTLHMRRQTEAAESQTRQWQKQKQLAEEQLLQQQKSAKERLHQMQEKVDQTEDLEAYCQSLETRLAERERQARELRDLLDEIHRAEPSREEQTVAENSPAEIETLRKSVEQLQRLRQTIQRRDQNHFQLDFLFRSMLEDRDREIGELQDQLERAQRKLAGRGRRRKAEDPRQGVLFPGPSES